MEANGDKCHPLVTAAKPMTAVTKDNIITTSQKYNLSNIKLDSSLSFENQVTNLCKKVQKLHALARAVSYMDVDKRKCLMKTFIMSQFDYCPLVWMFHSRKLNKIIKKIN